MAIRLGFLSTYPPTQCGIATFCQSLAGQLLSDGVDVGVVRLVDAPREEHAPVVGEWVTSRPSDGTKVAALLDTYDAVVVQHEYGIFGGPDGEDVIEVLARVQAPVITVLHTVLTAPSPNQRRVMSWLVDYSAALVTMTWTARDRLVAGWGVDPARVTVIPHGAVDNRPPRALWPARTPHRTTVLTWGLLSEGKGIEWALLAMADLRERMDLPIYKVVGQTHPRVLEREGEAYRDRLLALAHDLDLSDCVVFDDRYLSGPALREVVRDADVILLPYDSVEQVTSGVLTEAVAAGKPVISTSFPHAVELLSGGAGVLVPQRDPGAIADALEQVLAPDGTASAMANASRKLATSLLWPAVARRYLDLATSLQSAPVATAV
jgi:glycosyltransferase involved in cell wall biosynthesis